MGALKEEGAGTPLWTMSEESEKHYLVQLIWMKYYSSNCIIRAAV